MNDDLKTAAEALGAKVIGRYLGYADYCINAFINLSGVKAIDGFLMCAACSRLDADDVLAGVASRRRHHEPFPHLTTPAFVLEDFMSIDVPSFTVERKQALAAHLEGKRWGLWCTLYTDASNAGGGRQGWAWGARARIDEQVTQIFEVPVHLSGSGLSPEAGSEGSHLGELWAIAHGARMVLDAWPFVRGIGVRSDSQAAVEAVDGCGGRSKFVKRSPNGGPRKTAVDDARKALHDLLAERGVLVKAKHVHGHGRAEHAPQRAFNKQVDSLARSTATRANGGRR